MAPLVADQAILGEYAVISQLLNNQVKKGEVDGFVWTDKDGPQAHRARQARFARRTRLVHHHRRDRACGRQRRRMLEEWATESRGHRVTTTKVQPAVAAVREAAADRRGDPVSHAAVHLVYLPREPRHLRMLAEGANCFSQGDYAVRIELEGAPEVSQPPRRSTTWRTTSRSLIASSGKSESKNKLLATIVEQSSEAILGPRTCRAP